MTSSAAAVELLWSAPGRWVERCVDDAGRSVVVKRFASGARADWLRETAAAFGLSPHPNLVRCLDTACGEDGEGRLVYEYLPGGSIRPPLADAAVRPCLVAVLEGLAHLHAHGWVHCDIKPANVFFDPDGARYALGDLGAAAPLREARRRPHGIGSPAYMAPERDYDRFDARSDLYSVGVLAFELVTGAPPFEGPPDAVRRAHLAQAPPLERVADPALRAWIARLLRKQPAGRFASAREALAALVAEAPIVEASVEATDFGRPDRLDPRAAFEVDMPLVRLRVAVADGKPFAVVDTGRHLRWIDLQTGRPTGAVVDATGPALRAVADGCVLWTHKGRIEARRGLDGPIKVLAAGLSDVAAVDLVGDRLAWAGHARGALIVDDAPPQTFPVQTFGFTPAVAVLDEGVAVSGGRLNDRIRLLLGEAPALEHRLDGPVLALDRIGPQRVAAITASVSGPSGATLWIVDAESASATPLPERRALGSLWWSTAEGVCTVDDRGEIRRYPIGGAHELAASPDGRWVVTVARTAGGAARLQTWEGR